MQKAVFLDRDGTINQDKGYLCNPCDFAFIPGAVEAIKIFRNLGYKVIVITNQSAVARGFYDEEAVRRLHNHMNSLLALEGASVDAYYYCPHHPEGIVSAYKKDCDCRKPAPGMIRRAKEDFGLDLSRCVCVGDRDIDVLAGMNGGVGHCALVRGNYPMDEKILQTVPVFNDLLQLAHYMKNTGLGENPFLFHKI